MIEQSISRLRAGADLGYDEAYEAASEMLEGGASEAQMCDLLSGLADKGETDPELLAMLDCMQERSVRVTLNGEAIDVCGTGGDGASTFNVSTAAAFVAAAAGCPVAKHGNRSSSGAVGSADVFEYFGYDVNQSPDEASQTFERFGVCFMFAQKYHPAMRHVAPARKKLRRRTAFNILGPLCNPARVRHHLVGVSSDDLLHRLPRLLQGRGSQTVMTVRSRDGLDELSSASLNHTCLLREGTITNGTVDPESLGMRTSSLDEMRVSNVGEAMTAFVSVLEGTANHSMADTVALNAAAALIVGGKAGGFEEGVEMATDAVNNGSAFRLLSDLAGEMGGADTLEEVRKSRTY